jgi:hypothetical protein
MAGNLLPAAVWRAIDQNGLTMAGAKLQFYLTGTTTAASVYANATLATALSNPVVADGAGLFPAIYLDPTVTYRMQLQTSGGQVIADVDPVSVTVTEATLAQVNAGLVTGVYVSPAKLAAWTGIAAALGYTPLNKAGDTATNLTLAFSSFASNSAGYLGAPVNEEDVAYTFALSDSGKMVRANNGAAMAYTIPPSTFPVGTAIVVRNVGAGVVTITRGSGVSLMLAGSGTSKDVALAQWGFATLIQEATNSWVISGTGIS